MQDQKEEVATTEIEETTGLKTVDTFEELQLNPDLLRGIYGSVGVSQPSVLRSRPSFNKRGFCPW